MFNDTVPDRAEPPAASLTSEPEKLLPCPFCLATPVLANSYERRSDGCGWLRCVVCLDCDASGPQEHDDEEAAAMWNRRLSSPVSGTDDSLRERVADLIEGKRALGVDPALHRLDQLTAADAIIDLLSASPTPPIPMIAEVGEREALTLAQAVRDMTRAENVHARGIVADLKAGRMHGTSTSRDDVDMIQANLYAAWPIKRLNALIATLTAKTERAE